MKVAINKFSAPVVGKVNTERRHYEPIMQMCVRHSIGAALGLLVITSWVLFYHPSPQPSDDDLIGRFHSHRGELERLVWMANEDSNVRGLGCDYVEFNDYKRWPIDGEWRFSRQRWNQYQDLFHELGSAAKYQSVEVDREHGLVLVPASIEVFDPKWDETYFGETNVIVKGYAYSREPLSENVASLDELSVQSNGRFYRKIAEHWYLYLDDSWGHGE